MDYPLLIGRLRELHEDLEGLDILHDWSGLENTKGLPADEDCDERLELALASLEAFKERNAKRRADLSFKQRGQIPLPDLIESSSSDDDDDFDFATFDPVGDETQQEQRIRSSPIRISSASRRRFAKQQEENAQQSQTVTTPTPMSKEEDRIT